MCMIPPFVHHEKSCFSLRDYVPEEVCCFKYGLECDNIRLEGLPERAKAKFDSSTSRAANSNTFIDVIIEFCSWAAVISRHKERNASWRTILKGRLRRWCTFVMPILQTSDGGAVMVLSSSEGGRLSFSGLSLTGLKLSKVCCVK